MGQRYAEISDKLKQFIAEQKIFFVGTATADSKVNVSPKGMDSLRVTDKNRVVWLNVTGSGNETAAHVQENPRMTLMFAAFEGNPMILRLYGTARVVHQNDPEWQHLIELFDPIPGARQIFDLTVEFRGHRSSVTENPPTRQSDRQKGARNEEKSGRSEQPK